MILIENVDILITKDLAFEHNEVHVKKKINLQSKLDQCYAVFVQPHCSVCRVVYVAHFVRSLMSEVAPVI